MTSVEKIPVLNEQIQNPARHGPSQHLETAQFGGGGISDEQRLWPNIKRRAGAKLILPEPPGNPAAHFVRHHADRDRQLSRLALKLEVTKPDFLKSCQNIQW